MKLRVKEDERLVRDSENFAILNTDINALRTHEQKMAQLRTAKNRDDDINNMKRDISEIKDLLSQLLRKEK